MFHFQELCNTSTFLWTIFKSMLQPGFKTILVCLMTSRVFTVWLHVQWKKKMQPPRTPLMMVKTKKRPRFCSYWARDLRRQRNIIYLILCQKTRQFCKWQQVLLSFMRLSSFLEHQNWDPMMKETKQRPTRMIKERCMYLADLFWIMSSSDSIWINNSK